MTDEKVMQCFSCDEYFQVEDQNDRPEGYFCDKCIENDSN